MRVFPMPKALINQIHQDLCRHLTTQPCVLQVWAGLIPDRCEDPPRGYRLLHGSLEGTWVCFLPDEPLRVSASWERLTIEHAGVPNYWRIVTAEGPCHMQGAQSHWGVHTAWNEESDLRLTIHDEAYTPLRPLMAGHRVRLSLEGTISLR